MNQIRQILTQLMPLRQFKGVMRFASHVVGVAVGLLGAVALTAQDSAPSSAVFGLIFKRIDQNGDGRVTKAELELQGRKAGWLAAADFDGDGSLTRKEVVAFFERKKHSEGMGRQTMVYEFPEGTPINESSCRAAAEYSAGHHGFSTLIMVNGETVFEQYDHGWAPAKSNRLASGTKSFSGVILALAVQDGLLELDEPVSKTITEWQDYEELKPITIRQLLSLTSGMHPGDVGIVPSYETAIQIELDEKLQAEPGTKFAYGPRPFQIFGEVITRKLAAREDLGYADPLAYLDGRVLGPIEMVYTDWKRDENGSPRLPSGAYLTAREWVKLGELCRNEGKHGDEYLFDQKTFRQCLEGSETYGGYGLTFWLLDAQASGLEGRPWLKGAYMAAGAGKQRLYVLPAAGVVVVRQGESKKDFEDSEMLDRLFPVAPAEAPAIEEEDEPKDSDFVGLPLEEGEALAKQRKLACRVTMIDGEGLMVTTDYRTDRINFSIAKGKIVKVTRG